MKFQFLFKTFLLVMVFTIVSGLGGRPMFENAELKNNGTDNASSKMSADSIEKILVNFPPKFNCRINERSDEFHCLLCNCYHESRGESLIGRMNVDKVVYSRQISPAFPNTVCGVITQPVQFSWLNKGASQPHEVLNTSNEGVQKCIQSVSAAAKYKGTWFASNYHTTSVSPKWRGTCRKSQIVGAHIFYTGGCGSVRPPSGVPQNTDSAEAVAWLDLIFSFPKAMASMSPVDLFFKQNPKYKYKSDFTKDVEKLFGPKHNPALAQGDFNGDSIDDYVAIMIENKKHYMVFFISNGKDYTKKIKEISDMDNMYLSTVPKKDVISGLPNNKSRDLVQLEMYLGQTTAFFVEKDQIVEFKGKLKF